MGEISIDYLRSRRDAPGILKVQLSKIRGAQDSNPVVVVEGNDDLIVIDAWITRIRPDLVWHPLPAKGKRGVLEFRAMLGRDTTGVGRSTYFVVDHDYDGLSQSPGDDVYVLPAHSVENFLSASRVVRSLLQTDLHVVGNPGLLDELVNHYDHVADHAVQVLLPACKLLVASLGQDVGRVCVNEGVGSALTISVDELKVVDSSKLRDLVTVQRPPGSDASAVADQFFEGRPLRLWVRGKFLLHVFRKWCQAAFEGLKAGAAGVDKELQQNKFANFSPSSLDVRSLAARTDIPEGFREFVELMAA